MISCSSYRAGQKKAITQQDIENCNYLENYKWLKETFEKNDAGFEWGIQEKGMDAYKKHCAKIEERIKNAKDVYECRQILNDWGYFFRKGHFVVQLNYFPKVEQVDSPIKTETVAYSLATIKEQQQKYKDPFIGVWYSSPYKVGIVLDTINSNRKYVGFILETDAMEWKAGQVKLEIFEKNNSLSSNFYMRNHSLEKRDVNFKNDAELWIGDMQFFNIGKINGVEKQRLESEKPFFTTLSKKTTLLCLPTFDYREAGTINSLIEDNKKTILSHENLIIDLRNNAGGNDYSWKKIIPLIYTNPIKTVGVEFLSTPLNRKLFWANNSFLAKLLARGYVKKLKRNNGKFVVLESVQIEKLDEILPNPKTVIILVDNGCVSSGEQFLLSAKQSKKVKIYGERTFGSLDVSNVVFATSPDGCFDVAYAMSRTLRPKSERIDGVGVKPDVMISDTIPKYKWIDFVLKEIEKE